jgi:amino acid adenylation domain-containing protein
MPAVAGRGVTLTYACLDWESNRIARLILERFPESQRRIGLLFDHGHEMIVAILGVLKSGNIYVPLDPAQPALRLGEILNDCGCGAILTTDDLVSRARELPGAHSILTIAAAQSTLCAPVRAARSGSSVAYILYTSGSTGKPKGVYQNDRNVAHFAQVYCANLGIGPRDRLTLLASYAFDAAVMDIFGALLSGASLHLFDVRASPVAQLYAWLKRSEVTVWHSTPTLFRLACQTFPATGLPSVRCVVLGGEEARPADVAIARSTFGPNCVLVNGYGPTESTVTAQYFALADVDARAARLPIGRPVTGSTLFLVDKEGRPTDVRGELCIQGPHIALGYWGNPALTAERFCDSADGRYYRTGDIVFRSADGSLEYLGRADGQFKLRGYRIELGEISAALRMHPDVVDAVATLLENARGTPAIMAAVVRASGAQETKDLLAFLKSRLPAYMLPATLMCIDKLPLLANGKVDGSKLRQFHEPAAEAAARTAPRTDTERRLQEIWAAILKDPDIGTNEDFFELGGDSLMAMWMLASVRESLNAELTLVDLFEAPTIAELALRAARAMQTPAEEQPT